MFARADKKMKDVDLEKIESLDWKQLYSEYLQTKKQKRAEEKEKFHTEESRYKEQLLEIKKKTLDSEYIRESFKNENYVKMMEERQAKANEKKRAVNKSMDHKREDQSVFYKKAEKEFFEMGLTNQEAKRVASKKKEKILEYAQKVKKKHPVIISEMARKQNKTILEKLEQQEKIKEAIEEKRQRAKEKQKDYLNIFKEQGEGRSRRNLQKSIEPPFDPHKKEPGNSAKFKNYLEEIRNDPKMLKQGAGSRNIWSSLLMKSLEDPRGNYEQILKQSEKIEAKARRKEFLEKVVIAEEKNSKEGIARFSEQTDDLYIDSIKAKLTLLDSI